jgi:hypothetical protein
VSVETARTIVEVDRVDCCHRISRALRGINLLDFAGKGRVGKSFAAFLLAQCLPDKSVLSCCFDADLINNTVASFLALTL